MADTDDKEKNPNDQAREAEASLRKRISRSQRDISKNFRNIMDEQARLYEQANKNRTLSDVRYFKERSLELGDSLSEELDNLKKFYDNNKRLLDKQDKQAFLVYYKNRRDDIRQLEREARYRFSDIEEEGTNAFESIGKSIDNLQDLINAININDIAGQLEDAAQSFVDVKRELQTQISWTGDEWKQYASDISDIVSKTKNKISRSEVAQISQSVVSHGITDEQQVKDYTEALTELQMSTNTSADSINDLIDTLKQTNDGASTLKSIGDGIKAIQKTNILRGTTVNDLTTDINDLSDSILYASGDNFDKAMKEYSAANAAGENNYIAGIVNPILKTIAQSNATQIGELSQQYSGFIDVKGLKSMMSQGDYEEAYTEIAKAISDNKDNLLTYGLGEGFGVSDDALGKVQRFNYQDFADNLNSFDQTIKDSSGEMLDYIKSDEYKVSMGTQISNAWGNSWLGQKLSDFIDETGIDMKDVAVGITGFKSAIDLLSKIPGISNVLGKIPVLGNLFKTAGTAAEAGGAAAAGTAGMNILGFGAPGGMATLGTGDALSAGLLTTAATGIGGGIMVAKDAVGGVKKSKDWLGSDSTGSKVASGIGGAIGGTGTGIGEKGATVGSTAKNILGNAGKGAAIGATVGSIIPGLGTAIGAAVGGGIGAVTGAIGGKRISAAFKALGDGAASLSSKIVDLGKNGIDWLGGKLSDVGTSIGNAFVGDQETSLKSRLTTVGSVLTGDGSFKDKILGVADALAGDNDGSLKDKLDSFGKSLSDWASSLGDKISDWGEGVKDYWSGVGDYWSNKLGFANGLSEVPQDMTAKIHKGESVLTKNQSNLLRNVSADGGIDVKSVLNNVSSSSMYLLGSTISNTSLFKNGKELIDSVLNINTDNEDKFKEDKHNFKLLRDNLLIPFKSIYNRLERTGALTKLLNKLGIGTTSSSGGSGILGGSSVTGNNPASTTSSDDTKSKIWNFFASKGMSAAGIAGIMGNMQSESGFQSNNLQNSYEGRLGSDSQYTANVDNGSYTNFANDSAGYGLVQFTSSNLKKDLLNKAKKNGTSVGDLNTQLEVLWDQLNGSYKGLLNQLMNATSASDASTAFLTQYERPADISGNKPTRASQAEAILNQYSGTAATDDSNRFSTYDQGTPWVPDDQLAIIHKGEAVIPANVNPYNNTSSVNSSDNLDSVIDIIKWAVNTISSKDDEIISAIQSSNNQQVQQVTNNSPSYSDVTFSF